MVTEEHRDHVTTWWVEVMGGPADYTAQHGHPRLRMRHAAVPVDPAMAVAWMRCMRSALDGSAVDGDVRAFLEEKLEDLARFLRNRPG